ncbi:MULTISPECIES: hypothetical protein [unclassified Ensifer]|uniref:hypothetical protein n=1 Tax=unclassified Ensifer TaxID=2633371 RepID=UPI0008134F54|nr:MULTISPECIES: hypothetical protein [unclassified Ensifer]OCP07968.1 hypothetical protein BC362_10180 [Ensifer sp. LC14]OCP10922.1 hypothetical protein BC374_17785 [Ensifer sp. LC13]OCP11533.1 hypothetical protein BBX50_18070 [Ensifer sp. LC11]OCP33351.1 hypothetical protein BC364_16960 [Ensifer sp. LC499]
MNGINPDYFLEESTTITPIYPYHVFWRRFSSGFLVSSKLSSEACEEHIRRQVSDNLRSYPYCVARGGMTTCSPTPDNPINDIRRSMSLIAEYELAEIDADMSAIRIAASRGYMTGEAVAAYSRLTKRKDKLEAIISKTDEVSA